MIMEVAAHEMRRLGQVRKPLIIANIHDIAEAYRKAYPNDRLFYPGKTGFTPRKRQKALSEIRNKDWDCVLLTHTQFGLTPTRRITYGTWSRRSSPMSRARWHLTGGYPYPERDHREG